MAPLSPSLPCSRLNRPFRLAHFYLPGEVSRDEDNQVTTYALKFAARSKSDCVPFRFPNPSTALISPTSKGSFTAVETTGRERRALFPCILYVSCSLCAFPNVIPGKHRSSHVGAIRRKYLPWQRQLAIICEVYNNKVHFIK